MPLSFFRKKQPDSDWAKLARPLYESSLPLADRLHAMLIRGPEPRGGLAELTKFTRADVTRLDDISEETGALVELLKSLVRPRSSEARSADGSLRLALKKLHNASRIGRDCASWGVELGSLRPGPPPGRRLRTGGFDRIARLARSNSTTLNRGLQNLATTAGRFRSLGERLRLIEKSQE